MKMQTVNCTPLTLGRTFQNATATSDRIEIKFKLVLQVKLHENALNTENYEINSLLIEFSTMNHFFSFSCPTCTLTGASYDTQQIPHFDVCSDCGFVLHVFVDDGMVSVEKWLNVNTLY